MHHASSARVAIALLLSLCACDTTDPTDTDAGSLDGSAPLDAGLDASSAQSDGGAFDAGMAHADAALPPDGGTDGGTPDGGADAGAIDAGDAGPIDYDGSVPITDAVRIDAPPTYMGTNGSSEACTKSFRTAGYAPTDGAAKHPLFLYFVGTAGGASDQSSSYDALGPNRVTLAMAQRGFVALSVEYDNQLGSFLTNKQPCLFGSANADSLLARACARPDVDCALGIATWGHSQGGLLAHAASNLDERVRAVWTTGYSGMSGARLSYTRFRAVNGEADTFNASVSTMNKTAGMTGADACPDDGRDSCLRADGSGWILVKKSACGISSADHCWFNKRSCADNAETLEPNWVDASSNAPFALEANADWVADTTRRP